MKRLKHTFEQQYQQSKYSSTHGKLPSVKHTSLWSVNRLEDVLISRLLCRMLITPALLHRFNFAECDQCTYYLTSNSLGHILLTCRKYHQQRHLCFGTDLSSLYICSLTEFMNRFVQFLSFRISIQKFLLSINRF